MRSSDCTILMVPGLGNSGPEHWQTRWQQNLSSARRVEQEDWDEPRRDGWTSRLFEAVSAAEKPVVLIAHSLGVVTVVHAVPGFPPGKVSGAFLVGLPDIEENEAVPPVEASFAPIPRRPLPFPSILFASRSDPYCAYERAEDFAYAWGAAIADAGDSGHINTASGHGPWPEGLMRFAGFLKRL
jgi:predicted alpha/beta hydrolase family esterase